MHNPFQPREALHFAAAQVQREVQQYVRDGISSAHVMRAYTANVCTPSVYCPPLGMSSLRRRERART